MKKTQMTNEALCLAYQAGDRQAAEQLYFANYRFIRSIALAYAQRYPGLWMDADDFTQEGVIALLRAAETYSPGTNATFLTYARRIIHNAIRDVLRKALPRAEKEITHEPQEPTWGDYKKCSPEASSYEHNPEWIYLQKENTQRIQAAVAKLSVRENAWISVRYGFGDDAPLSHAEAARRYHLTKRRAQKLESSALHNVKTGYMPNTADWR